MLNMFLERKIFRVFKRLKAKYFPNLLVQRNSWVARLWIALFFRWVGFTHRGPLLVRPRLQRFSAKLKNILIKKIFRYLRSQSANQAMWQLQLKGLEIRLRLVKLRIIKCKYFTEEETEIITWSARQKPQE